MPGPRAIPAVEVPWEQALTWRLRRQCLIERAPAADMLAVVDRMGALHAQLLSSVDLALWARTDGLDRTSVKGALWEQRTLVKLWAMRKTLHVLPSSSLGLWLSAMGTYRNGPEWYGLQDPLMLEIAELIGRALHGRVLTRSALAAEVGRLSGSPDKEKMLHGGWGGCLKPASFLGQLCFAPSAGQQVTFTHPDTWLDQPAQRLDEGAALSAITVRYLSTYGPATDLELGAWWGVGRMRARRMLTALGDRATMIRVGSEPYWLLNEDVEGLTSTTPATGTVSLLPAFDGWTVCACRRDGMGSRPGPGEPALDPVYRTRIYRPQGWVSPVVVIDGRIEGVWDYESKGRVVRVHVDAFQRLRPWSRQAIEHEAARLADYLGGELQLTMT